MFPLRVFLVFAFSAPLLAGQAGTAPAGLILQPLASRSTPAGGTLFTLLPAGETGIVTENDYADPRIWTTRYNEFPVGAIGTGVAIGDYDRDGRPDIFVVSKTGTCRLFRNLGGWKFEDVSSRAGVAQTGDEAREWKQGASFADVNNDGWLDLHVCRFDAPNLLFINQGDGTFREEAAARGVAVRDASGMAAFCDYDGDGALDFYLQTNLLDAARRPDGQRDHLFHNDGTGHFTDVTEAAGISGDAHGHSATWWDADGDGRPDLYVANDFSAPDRLYHNNGDGTFTDIIGEALPCQPYHSMGADIADVNDDGRLDLFVGEMARRTHEGEYRTIAETRTRPEEEEIDRLGPPQYMRNMLFLNAGSMRFTEAAHLAGIAATDWTWSARFEDLDNDGRVDLQITNGMVREYDNVDLRARTMRAESALERMRTVRSAPVEAEANLCYRNLGDLRFEDVSARWGLDQKGVSFGAAFGDLDGDGDLDLIWSNYQAGVTVLRNDSTTGHRVVVELRGTRSNRSGIGARVEIETIAGKQVRMLLLSRGYLSSSEPIVHFGLGEDTRIKRLTVAWPSGTKQVFEKLAADQRLIVTEPEIPSNEVARVDPDPAPWFADVSSETGLDLPSREQPLVETSRFGYSPFHFNRRGPSLAVGDLDGDDFEEVVVGGTALDPLRILRADERGHFSASEPLPRGDATALNDGPVLILDADGDGRDDLLVTKGGVGAIAGSSQYQPRLWLNDGSLQFHASASDALPAFAECVGAACAADIDRDGRLDLFLGGRVKVGQYPLSPRSALWMNRAGRFEDVTADMAPALRDVGLVTSALWSDVDGDGWIDLLVATEWGGVRYFRNDQGRRFEEKTEEAGFASAGNGLWTSLAAADFNGDGRIDYAVGNIGLNTRYVADAGHPALLFLGEFSDRRAPLLIEAYTEGDKRFPWRTRRELGTKIPALLSRFPNNDTFARATIEDLFGAERLAAAKRYAATELRSGVFLSQPDGRHRFEALPRIAQIAPLQGMFAGDLNGDGFADLYALQNSASPTYSVGRFVGGLSQLLLGDGHGHFRPVAPAESGLYAPGDAKALVMLAPTSAGEALLLASRNQGRLLAFRPSLTADRHFLTIRLAGPAGNRRATGASVSVELRDGRSETLEQYSGGGYASQTSAALRFGYQAGNPPVRVNVRWPDGSSTEQPLAEPLPAVLQLRWVPHGAAREGS